MDVDWELMVNYQHKHIKIYLNLFFSYLLEAAK
jgi:hypothetical protein